MTDNLATPVGYATGSSGIDQLTGDTVAGPGSGSQASTTKSAQSGLIVFNAVTGLIEVTLGATGPGLKQDTAGVGVTPMPTVMTPQAPNAGSVGAAAVAGYFTVDLSPPVAPATTEAYFTVDRTLGTHYFMLGGYNGGGGGDAALYGGVGCTASLPFLIIDAFSGGTYFNSHTIAALSIDDAPVWSVIGATSELRGKAGYNVALNGVGVATYGGGTGVVALQPASVAPTTAVSGGVLYVDPVTKNLMFIGTSGVPRIVALA